MIERRYTIADVQELRHCSDDTVHRAIRAGDLRGTKVGGRWLFTESQVLQWLNPGMKLTRSGGGGRKSRAGSGLAAAIAK